MNNEAITQIKIIKIIINFVNNYEKRPTQENWTLYRTERSYFKIDSSYDDQTKGYLFNTYVFINKSVDIRDDTESLGIGSFTSEYIRKVNEHIMDVSKAPRLHTCAIN